MAFDSTFVDIPVDRLHAVAQEKHDEGFRFVQMLCRMADPGIDVIYTFMKDGAVENYALRSVDSETQAVPSISDLFMAAFANENEAHDLFGLNVEGIVIDFAGAFYDVAVDKPMTVLSPAQKAARDKAAKLAAAKAKEEPKAQTASDASKSVSAAPAPKKTVEEQRAAMEARVVGMDPEKAAKVRAAFEARVARESAKDGE